MSYDGMHPTYADLEDIKREQAEEIDRLKEELRLAQTEIQQRNSTVACRDLRTFDLVSSPVYYLGVDKLLVRELINGDTNMEDLLMEHSDMTETAHFEVTVQVEPICVEVEVQVPIWMDSADRINAHQEKIEQIAIDNVRMTLEDDARGIDMEIGYIEECY